MRLLVAFRLELLQLLLQLGFLFNELVLLLLREQLQLGVLF